MASVPTKPPMADAAHYRAFDGAGVPTDLAAIVAAAGRAEVVFLGENHDDPTAHGLQRELLGRLGEQYGASRSLVLSLEMFERDCQLVLDEYLAGTITEKQFLAASRPWPNYATDYRPLVEMAREKGWPVLAANAPQRYANLVSRMGRGALEKLKPAASGYFAPLPYPAASEKYGAKFRAAMGHMGGAHGSAAGSPTLASMLDAQVVRDATMAHAIAGFLKGASPKPPLVVHVNGNFHSEERLGTVELLDTYRPGTRALVVTTLSLPGFPNLPADTAKGLGDFVVVTDPKLPRSR